MARKDAASHSGEGCHLSLPMARAAPERTHFFLARNLRPEKLEATALAGKAMWLKLVHAGERHCRDGAKQWGA